MIPPISPGQRSTSTAAWTWRSALRVALVLTLAAFGAAQSIGEFTLPWHPYWTYGFNGSSSGTVLSVEPGSPAAHAGIQPGDRIDVSALTLGGRRRIVYLSMTPPGSRINVTVISHGATRHIALVAVPYRRTFADNLTNAIETIERFAYLAIATTLVLIRPSFLTWSFFFMAASAQPGVTPIVFLSDRAIVPFVVANNALLIAGAVASAAFAMLFPRPSPSLVVRRATFAFGLLGVAALTFATVNGYSMIFAWASHGSGQWSQTVSSICQGYLVGLNVIAVMLFGLNYARSAPAERLRMQWVAAGFAIGDCGTFSPALLSLGLGFEPPLALQNGLLALTIAIPTSVAYAILRHRVIDVRFFASRALVYGALTTVAVGLLGLLDFLVSRSIEATNLGVAVEAAGAIAIGIGLNRLHGAVDGAVDRFVFRTLHDAERHLNDVAKAMIYAREMTAIDRVVVDESRRALSLETVTVVRDFDPNSTLALRLHAHRISLDHGDALAIPLLVRDELLGYVLYGHHENGAALDPNDRRILERLTAAAATAYDHVLAEQRAQENQELRGEVSVLRSLLAPVNGPSASGEAV